MACDRTQKAVGTREQKSPVQLPSTVRTHEQPQTKLTNEATAASAVLQYCSIAVFTAILRASIGSPEDVSETIDTAVRELFGELYSC